MAKESKKQIKAQLINEISAQYRYKITRLENQIKYMENRLAQQHQETLEYRQRALKAEEELEKYQDWNRRLQEFMDMTPEEREKHFAELQTRNKLNEKMTSFMNMFQHLGLYL
jgi:hypothetical protein